MSNETSRQELEHRLGYQFLNQDLLIEALTHRAVSRDRHGHGWQHNQRLAFLGDSALKLILSQALMERKSSDFPERPATRGEMTNWRQADESEARCMSLAEALGLGPCIIPFDATTKIDRTSPSVLEPAFEAVVGAIFQDCGYEHARRVVTGIYARHPSPIIPAQIAD